MPLILGADSLAESKSWVDAAYAVHDDMKSHTGGATSLGRGAIMCKSTKQKLNTKSSTEAKVVGSSDYLPNTIWTRMFLAEQGYELTENIFYQDNHSAIQLEKNGRASCGQKSRHINIRYFFMQDRFESEGISVVYCPTDEMLADFFTKPLQGSLFRKFRAVLLGHCHVNTLTKSSLPPSEERVENPILEKVRSGASGQTIALPTKKKVSEQMEVVSAPTYASILKKGLKWAPVTVHSF
jgi:KUP system potassium uptake protein